MRADLSSIQQTLTPAAAAVLSQAMEEAGRRCHGQTTPLHAAAALLASPSGLLRHACVRSHPQSSHPLQCRALELCFSVALDRLPAAAGVHASSTSIPEDPPISNALMAALKRAQANQRRGCPEQQQQPILAVKVELDQLVISILDDPSVSRVMREASFSSPAVKAAIEQTVFIPAKNLIPSPSTTTVGGGGRNPYLNPRLTVRPDVIQRVLDIVARGQNRNPILVGDADPRWILREVIRRIESRSDPFTPPMLRGALVISLEKEFLSGSWNRIPSGIRDLHTLIESRVSEGAVVLDLGDLKWMVEGPSPEAARSVVMELAGLLGKFRECGGGGCQLWFVGTANSATYLRCQVHHPSMENDWDLQAVPIPASLPLPCLFPRLGSCAAIVPTGQFPPSLRSGGSSPKSLLCSLCMKGYECELAELIAEQFEWSSSTLKSESLQPLPLWLQAAKADISHVQPKEQDLKWKQRTEELLKRWREKCSCLHPFASPLLIGPPTKLQTSSAVSPPASPVKTDLVLGQARTCSAAMENTLGERVIKDSSSSKLDSFKSLLHGLTEKVAWQPEAASAIATAVVQCKSGIGRQRGIFSRGSSWFLFLGPDKVGKKKMAAALSELVFGSAPVTVQLAGDDGESESILRGRTSVDRIVEALRRNPMSSIVIEDVDRCDAIVKGTLKRGMEKGRLVDSHGREVVLGSAIFVLTSDLVLTDLKSSSVPHLLQFQKVLESASSGFQLEFSITGTSGKHQADWLSDDGERPLKKAKPLGLSLDLNLAVMSEDDNGDASDLTVEHEHGNVQEQSASPPQLPPSPASTAAELRSLVDDTIVFKPVDFAPLKRKSSESITSKFAAIVGSEHSIIINDDALEKVAGSLWLAGAGVTCNGLDDWMEKVLVPGLHHLRRCLKAMAGSATVQLTARKVKRSGGVGGGGQGGDCLPAVGVELIGL